MPDGKSRIRSQNRFRMNFVHLHVHSHYSILDGMSKVPDLVDKCMKNGMRAMALTDHGNMYGIKEFLDTADKVNGKPKKAVKECEEEIAKETDPAKRAELEKKLEGLKERLAAFVPFKPIVGIEAYCAHENYADEKLPGHQPHRGWHLILLAKNKQGYHNLCKLSSMAFTEGFYFNPRIDHELLERYHEGLICCSACLGGEIAQKIMKEGEESAERAALWFKNLFGDDYYLEMQRHKTDKPGADTTTYQRQEEVNEVLRRIAAKIGVKLIATNDVHFVEEDHAEAHDRLVCLNTGRDLDDPNRMRYTKQEWLKTPDEMAAVFADMPYALENTLEIADKVEPYSVNSDPIMPKFAIPEEFGTEEEYRRRITPEQLFDEFTRDEHGNETMSREAAEKKIKKLGGYDRLYRIKLEADYLARLAWEGARKRYGDELTEEQRERIVFELHIMKTMGFPGYFLIVQDYIRAAREELGVWVGPGRGSAAGSVVAYCLGITDLDPLHYDLLFERFLNPDRISLPDIDVDFDDDGRGKVLDWVTGKYGADHVAHIITYGTMGAKSAVADMGRVQKMPLSEVNRIKALIPDNFKQTINPATGKPFDDGKSKVPDLSLTRCFEYIPELAAERYGNNPGVSTMLKYAEQLENTNRQVGIHACGVIIGAEDLTNIAPVSTVRDRETDKDVIVTQYDGHVVESVGLIKMDFLGLKTLSLLKEAVRNVKKTRGEEVDIFHIPIDDELTYRLYQEGRTVGTFQFESAGMQKYLKELKPTRIEDLIAMNALYRPGPMEYIPQFIRRKQGLEPITYDIPVMEKYLKDTYGVTVYQEQVMLLSRLLADFTRGEADTLRKAMGKKQFAMLAMLKPKFLEGGRKNGHDPKVLEKIWNDWEKFASYAFNKSHAACYAWVSYQTAYMKAHYPAEYMAANLTRSKDNISDVTKFMEECKAMNISVLGPDVNASELNFLPDQDGNIRFGLGGVKGVGEGAVNAIVNERSQNGPYKDVYDFFGRVDLGACNRKTLESLVLCGAFDGLGTERREQYFATNAKGETMLELLMRYGNRVQKDKGGNELTLFSFSDETKSAMDIPHPKFLDAEPWSSMQRLRKEKELVGRYLTGHPLDIYAVEMELCTCRLSDLPDSKSFDSKSSDSKSSDPASPDSESAYPESPDSKTLDWSDWLGKSLTVAGMVVKTEEKTSKSNNPYMKFTLEDYSGTHDFFLFGKQYQQHAFEVKDNLFVMMEMAVQDRNADFRFRKADSPVKPEPVIKRIDLLSEVAKERLNLDLTLPVDSVTPDLTAELEEAMKTLPDVDRQPSELRVALIDTATRNTVELVSKTPVILTPALIRYLREERENSALNYRVYR